MGTLVQPMMRTLRDLAIGIGALIAVSWCVRPRTTDMIDVMSRSFASSVRIAIAREASDLDSALLTPGLTESDKTWLRTHWIDE